MSTRRICAITGSHGYLGGCLRDYLAARGWGILEFTRQPQAGTQAVRFRLGEDISPQSFANAAALVHCAYDFAPLRWSEIHSVNVQGSRKLFEAARSAGVEEITCISSISAYDGCRSLYGKAKLEIERIALDHGAQVIRPGLVYGRGPGGMFGKLISQIRKSSLIPLIGDGSQVQFLVHQDDLCAFIERRVAGSIDISTPVLTAANPQPWSLRDILREISRKLNRRVVFVPLPWRLVWAGLKSAEMCRLRLNFRSDSLISLMYQNPHPDFSANAQAGLVCRPFDPADLPS
ncbi:MAG: NAD-dependent epimerase/dehydratase family protein [Arenicellales bacterium]